MTHVLVTGAGGFSGARLVPELLRHGCAVTALIHSRRGRLPADVERQGPVRVVQGALHAPMELPASVDVVVHAAARSPGPGVTDADMERDNVEGTRRLVEYAAVAGAKAFIFSPACPCMATLKSRKSTKRRRFDRPTLTA